MVHYWALSIVRCPLDTRQVNKTNSTAPPTLYESMIHLGLNITGELIGAMFPHNADPTSSSASSSCSSDSYSDSGSQEVAFLYPDELFPFASTSILFGILTVLCLVLGVMILMCFHGLETMEARTHDPARPLIKKTVTSTTNNIQWALQFFANAAGSMLSLLCLQVPTLSKDNEKSKITVLVQNLFHGVSCVYLAVALNYQRTERVKDYKDAKPHPKLKQQAKFLNRTTFGIFVLFMVGEFAASHVVHDGTTMANVLFWVYITMFGIMAVPPLLAATWVLFHEAEVQPTLFAKRLIMIAMILHFFLVFPATLWNRHLLEGFVRRHPCPMRFLSFYDMILLAHLPLHIMIFAFVVIEHRRNSLLGQMSHYQDVCERLHVASTAPAATPRAAADYGSINASAPAGQGSAHSPRQGSMLSTDVSLRSVQQTPKASSHLHPS
jgi:hypothetical protein